MVKKHLSIFMSLILIFSITPITLATDTTTNKIKEIDKFLQDSVPSHSFNGCVLIARNGKILLNKAYGMADFKNKIKNTTDTKFAIASNTKSITATAIMQLAEKGKLKLTDTLNKYIPDYPRGKEITIKELLTHSSGIYDYTNDNTDTKSLERICFSNKPTMGLINLFKNKPLKFKPGSSFSYSNSGYVLLGYIIEKVSGKSYGTYIKENIFNKAGMNTAAYAPFGQIKKMAQPTGISIYNEKVAKSLPLINYTLCSSAGGISCTTSDLYKFDMELLKTNSKLLTNNYVKKMFKGQIGASGFGDPTMKYGYGWFVQQNGTVWHGGDILGYHSFNTIVPKDKTIIVLLENVEDSSLPNLIAGTNDNIIDILSK
jgi:CubicO group peptidase (beta-lactamase class C family)